MNCANCGRIPKDTTISEDGYIFCNTLCRYEWRKNGKPNPLTSVNKPWDSQIVTVNDLEYHIELPGFENRNMIVRLSYWTRPKFFLDGNKLKPTKKRMFLMYREFAAVSNFGKSVSLRLQQRPLDLIPVLFIDGQQFRLASPLSKWEYFWICLPLIMLFFGGALGGLLGTIATYSNSILIRKFKSKFPRYLFTGATTLMSVALFLKISGYFTSLLFLFAPTLMFDGKLKEYCNLSNKSGPQMISQNTRADSVGIGQGRTLIHYLSLPYLSKKDVNIDSMRQALSNSLTPNIRTDEKMQILRDNDVTFVFKYYDKDKIEVLDFLVKPSDYR